LAVNVFSVYRYESDSKVVLVVFHCTILIELLSSFYSHIKYYRLLFVRYRPCMGF